ncbi:putative amino acid permease YfnA [Smittium mucronatum]|uniref:Putative amino acid permease YfnA n=1 Tax=Smittium mucronatum TaxID=133383 RepID=A0A1R0H4U4_9FUNG|nr:putative amino acid permease YfnA [Smittium mucronatum]
MSNFKDFLKTLVRRKPIDVSVSQGEHSELKRSLGAVQLTFLGIGCIIGTGIFVLTGRAAAEFAGPAIAISFVIAAAVSAFSAFSYAELSTMIPIAGSAYSYTVSSMGEFFGWVVGWDLMLEYLVGASTVASGWSAYIVVFFESAFRVTFSKKTTQSPLIYSDDKFSINTGSYINLPAIFISLAVTAVLVVGIQESSAVNTVVVMIKIIVILIFIFGGIKYINSSNLKPFIPKSQGGKYGGVGILKGAQKVFFSYIGFDAVSTAAQEAKNPQRDLPIGIILSLTVCTILYIATSLVLCGIADYKDLNVSAPISHALSYHPNTRWMQILINLGAVAGLTSVILVLLLSQPRLFMAMANDGMFPKFFARIHPRFKTPFIPTIIGGVVCAVLSGVLPVDLLGDMTSAGTLFAFLFVNIGVIILRHIDPHRHRDFRVPFGPYIFPVLGSIIAVALIVLSGESTVIRLFIWMGIGLVIYFAFARRHSKIGQILEDYENEHGYTHDKV